MTGPLNRQPAITLRPVSDGDMEFLYRVYAATRSEEMNLTGWSAEQIEVFLRTQFQTQHSQYRLNYPDASFEVIEADGRDVGRLYVDRRADEIRVIDIAILPEHRGAGIGSALLSEILEEARREDKPVRIHVLDQNPAIRIYQRLGFRAIEERGLYWLMEWRAPAGSGVKSQEAGDRK